MTLPESTTGIISDAPVNSIVELVASGGGDTPPIFSPPRFNSEDALNSFSAASLGDAAGTVKQTLSNAASSLSTAATNLYNTVTGKGNAAAAPVVNVQASTAPAGGTSMTWLYVLLVAGAAYAVYHYAKGKGKSFISKGRASGTAAKRYGK